MFEKATYKVGFWSLFAIVMGSQLGSGFFVIPSVVAKFGFFSLAGWCISGFGAISLTLVLSKLSSWTAKTGGPHTFANVAFGRDVAFFTGWTYWVISWASTSVIVVASIGYLTPIIGESSHLTYLMLEIALVLLVMILNCQGIQTAGVWEFIFALFQIIPLLIIPIAAFYLSKGGANTLGFDDNILSEVRSHDIGNLVLVTFWCFIGLESATTTAGSVHNPKRTIPRATIIGTLAVFFIYMINSLCILGAIPFEVLSASKTPYVDIVKLIFGEDWHIPISLVSSIICIGALNAWTLVSGQISLGLAEDRFLPRFFAKKNKKEAPFVGLMVSCVGIIVILVITSNSSIAHQISNIIDLSVSAFIFVYIVCIFSFFKLLRLKKSYNLRYWSYGIIACFFCFWLLFKHPFLTIASIAYIISGIPIYFLKMRCN
jgi:APA family basic amino acid/polyamine antiporter